MKLLVLDENYPHLGNLMGDVFVHVRVKEYAKKHTVKVLSFFQTPRVLEYEGITLQQLDSIDEIVNTIAAYKPDKILIHFYQSWMLERVIKKFAIPVIIWVHGYEALGWYRRLFNYSWPSPVLLNYIIKNTKQQYHFNKLIQYANKQGNIEFVFVSKWMRRITEADSACRIKKAHIIANPIDTDLFAYKKKSPDLKSSILLLRSFGTRKYANDLSVEAIRLLSKKDFFDNLHFTIIGDGQLFESTLEPVKQFKNISIQKGALRQRMIPEIHAQHGIFLCPTRQDAQGVSMCEAMSSGLIPVTSDNTAIPEFVENNVSGYLTDSPKEIACAIEELYHEPEKFEKMSCHSAKAIRQKCSLDFIVQQELQIIE